MSDTGIIITGAAIMSAFFLAVTLLGYCDVP